MNILITGAGGFIGEKLSIELLNDHRVFKLYKTKKDNKNDTCIYVNLLYLKNVEKFLPNFAENYNIDIIIHLASLLSSADDIDNVQILNNNITISENVALIAKILNPKKLINFSSMSVYPAVSGNYTESSRINPLPNNDCFYGLSKYCTEVIFEHLLRNTDINVCHFRISNVYGKGIEKDRLIPKMLKELKDTNGITVYGNGERASNFIKIDKLIDITKIFITNEKKGIYNIGGENISYYNLAERIIKKYGKKNSFINKIDKGNKETVQLDTSKIEKIINLNKFEC